MNGIDCVFGAYSVRCQQRISLQTLFDYGSSAKLISLNVLRLLLQWQFSLL